MKKTLICSILILSSVGVFAKSPKKSKKPNFGMTTPKQKVVSYITYSESWENAEFEGKTYEVVLRDEFNSESLNTNIWGLGCSYWVDEKFSSAVSNDGTYLGSKIYGNKNPFDKIILHTPINNEVMGKQASYQKDGILHLTAMQKKIGNDWHLYLPSLGTLCTFPRGTIYEIRYKLPVKGKDTVLHNCLELRNEDDFNEQGWHFKELFLAEMLSGTPNKVQYNPSMWFAKKIEHKEASWIDAAIADYDVDKSLNFDYNNEYNTHDDNNTFYDVTEEDFLNEWHTATCVYDDERFAVYQDGLKVYEWKWADWPECGMPQDYKDIKGGVWFIFSYGLAGDWANFFNVIEPVGEFDDVDKEMDVLIDYFRVYKEVK